MSPGEHSLRLKRLGIDTYKEPVIYMRKECHVCRAEGFESQGRILVSYKGRSLIATLNKIGTDILETDEAGLSEHAWAMLGAEEGGRIKVAHPRPVSSLGYVRSKIYGNDLSAQEIGAIIGDVAAYRYSDIEIASFVTACAGRKLNGREIIDLTEAMVDAGERMHWSGRPIVDKHCVGGLPGNRTTPIVVAIVAAFGLTMPKTSSRAITSPAGTADTMEVLAPVDLDMQAMRRVVEQEKGCVVWGGSASLSPADDILIRVEKALDLDSEGQLVASVLSKKIAAGSTHVLIDMPIGPTAKVRSAAMADHLAGNLVATGERLGLTVSVHVSDGTQPVGRGIGPALEARDLVSVLRNDPDAPHDLRAHALMLAGKVLEFSPDVKKHDGLNVARGLLDSGAAWKKFQAICAAQGGMRDVPKAAHTHVITAPQAGRVVSIDNRRLARVAKMAGAPADKAAGVDFHAPAGFVVERGTPLFTIHAETPGELDYALDYLKDQPDIVTIGEGRE